MGCSLGRGRAVGAWAVPSVVGDLLVDGLFPRSWVTCWWMGGLFPRSREGCWLVRELASPRTGTGGRRGAACCCLFPLLVPMIGSDEALIPEGAVFENAALRGVIDIDDTETLAIAFSPLKVVEQRPDEVAT